MQFDHSVTLSNAATSGEAFFLRAAVSRYNEPFGGEDSHEPLTVIVRTDSGNIAGGLVGGTYWGWLYIAYLWIEERYRGSGLGREILLAAEEEAVKRGCGHAHVETHDFQAPGFCSKFGYELFAALGELPPGHRKLFFKKELS